MITTGHPSMQFEITVLTICFEQLNIHVQKVQLNKLYSFYHIIKTQLLYAMLQHVKINDKPNSDYFLDNCHVVQLNILTCTVYTCTNKHYQYFSSET